MQRRTIIYSVDGHEYSIPLTAYEADRIIGMAERGHSLTAALTRVLGIEAQSVKLQIVYEDSRLSVAS